MRNKYFNLGLEDETPPPKQREDEVVIYARITELDGLKKAVSKEVQEQWEVKTPKGRFRVRKATKEGLESVYTLTIKTKDSASGINGGTEVEQVIDSETFEAFRHIAEVGMIKDRYVFNVTKIGIKTDDGVVDIPPKDIFFEVDVFPKEDGTYHEWCKIDLEVTALLKTLKEQGHSDIDLRITVSDLPFKPGGAIVDSAATPTQKEKIHKLYDECFLTKK